MKENKMNAYCMELDTLERAILDETVELDDHLMLDTYWPRDELMKETALAMEATDELTVFIDEGHTWDAQVVEEAKVKEVLMAFNNLLGKLPEDSLIKIPSAIVR